MADVDKTGAGALPSFANPPVTEVALSVAFDPLTRLRLLDIYDFYKLYYGEHEFPRVEEKPPYVIPVERFGDRLRIPDVKFEVLDRAPLLRHWFVNETGTQLVQLQPDWFARNWRKHGADPTYHRYPSLREPFLEDLVAFAGFIKDRGIGVLAPTQCEISYVNQIHRDGVWNDHGDLARVVKYWHTSPEGQFPHQPEQAQFTVSYLMPSSPHPTGRLHVELGPAVTADQNEPIFVLTLTARGTPHSAAGIDGVMEFLDMAHEWIVRCFADITTDEMQTRWERER